MIENIITIVGLLFGVGIMWTLGYLKGRWDAAVSIGKRYNITPAPENR